MSNATDYEDRSLKIRLKALLYHSPEQLRIYLKNITDKKRAESALRDTQEKYRQIIETAQEGIWLIDENCRTTFVNNKMCEILGYSKEEMLGKEIFYFMDASGKETAVEQIRRRKRGIIENFDACYISKKGKSIWTNICANPVFNDQEKYTGALAMVSDITEKRALRDQLAEKNLNEQKEIAKAVIASQERERAEIGMELHDNVTQLLVASRLYLNLGISKPEAGVYIAKSQEYIMEAIDEIRKLSHRLVGPDQQQPVCLIDSLKELVNNIIIIKDFKISFNVDNYQEGNTEAGLKLAIYRIIQEQLNNIIKHAEATEIEIELVIEQSALVLMINDNGKGFDTSVNRKGIGLSNIRNRALIYNGELQIVSCQGAGCQMKIVFKLQ